MQIIMKKCCDMRGFLSFMVLRLASKNPISGEEIRKEIKKRKGQKPSPGTIYPVLKTLSENGWIEELEDGGKEKKYKLTVEGRKELKSATKKFIAMFSDMKEEFEKISKKL